MPQFPHLNFIQKVVGKPRYSSGGSSHEKSVYNKAHRADHGEYWRQVTTDTQNEWFRAFDEREKANLAELNPDVIPIYIQINPDLFTTQFDLEAFGIEIISEQEEGFIIGASLDNFRSLREKIEGFIRQKHGSGKIADFWQIFEGNREDWKPKQILSEELYAKWGDLSDEEIYKVEVSIAFDKPSGKQPDELKQGGERRLAEYRLKVIKRDESLMERQSQFERFISHYGEITSPIIDLEDSFGCEVSLTGMGLKDLVVNYQYVFEVSELENVTGLEGIEGEFPEDEIMVLPPPEDAVHVGVIDSGVMEANKFLSSAIIPVHSKSYLTNDNSTADHVARGGHGTKVAGAILYPLGASEVNEPYQLPCFIRNLRILDGNNKLTHSFPAELVQRIVRDNQDCQIFNLSVTSSSPYRTRHMSNWATMIDKLVHEDKVLFVVAVGNVRFSDISHYLGNNRQYPAYLDEPYCRLANPAQSSFALSVGSINHVDFEDNNWMSLGNRHEIAGYSRVGAGIWGHIKPDVVEFGGGLVISKNGLSQIREHAGTATELIRSTLHGGGVKGKDSVGTSYSAPKVSHLAAVLRGLYRDEDVNLIRALIVQGARLPNQHFLNPTGESIRHFGYGLPNIDRVTKNTDHRITFYNCCSIKTDEGHIYSLKIPDALRNQGDEYDILIEITLAYTAKVRRTRQKTKSYLSTWLDWTTSKINEPFDQFKDFVLKEIENTETSYDKRVRRQLLPFPWKIKTRVDGGDTTDVSRNNSTIQKDWAIIKSYDLDEEISIAVRGHRGWDRNEEVVPYSVTMSLEVLGQNIPIYESIRVANQVEIET